MGTRNSNCVNLHLHLVSSYWKVAKLLTDHQWESKTKLKSKGAVSVWVLVLKDQWLHSVYMQEKDKLMNQ